MSANLYGLLRAGFASALDRPACVDAAGRGVSYGELDELAARFAGALHARGVRPGDRVLAQTEKCLGALALYLGCLRLGALYVPLNLAYTAEEVRYFLTDAQARLFVGPLGRAVDTAQVTLEGPNGQGLWAQARAANPLWPIAACAPEDGAAIVYTSGTTGRSKGALLSHANLAANAASLHRLWGLRAGDVLLHALPIFHVHGLFVALHCALLNASTVILLPRFDAAEVAGLLPAATVFMGVPTYYTRLLGLAAFGRETCRNMRLFVCGSAPLPSATWGEFAARTGHEILERYGMTETGILTSNPLVGERVPGTVGYALPEIELRVVDERGAPRALGETGSIEVRGPSVFRGYWPRAQRGAPDFHADGFFVTGDLGALAPDGRLTLVGRTRDLVISGGLNVYPKEVEQALDALPGVLESAVIGVPHPDLGEAVVAVVVRGPGSGPAPEAPATSESILAALEPHLARFKQPRMIFFAAELPRNAMGKIQKALLRARHARAFASRDPQEDPGRALSSAVRAAPRRPSS